MSTYFRILVSEFYNLKTCLQGEGVTSDQSNSSGLLLMVWDTSRRMIWRHAISIFIRNKGNGSPALVQPEVQLVGNFEDIAPMDFTCTRCHQRAWRFSPGESGTRVLRSRAEDSTDYITTALLLSRDATKVKHRLKLRKNFSLQKVFFFFHISFSRNSS